MVMSKLHKQMTSWSFHCSMFDMKGFKNFIVSFALEMLQGEDVG